jgi:hypothetical protein
VTFSHHNAAHGDQRGCGKAPFLSTKQTSNSNITTSTDLAIGLNDYTATQVVEDKGLMGLSKTQFPGQSGVFDAGPSRGTSTTIVTRDQDVIGLGLGHSGGNDTNSDLGYELHGNT